MAAKILHNVTFGRSTLFLPVTISMDSSLVSRYLPTAIFLYTTLLELVHPFEFLDQSSPRAQSLLYQTTLFSYYLELWGVLVLFTYLTVTGYAFLLNTTVQFLAYCLKESGHPRSSTFEDCVNHDAALQSVRQENFKSQQTLFSLKYVFILIPLLIFNGSVVNRDMETESVLESCWEQILQVVDEALYPFYCILCVILVIGFASTIASVYKALYGNQTGAIQLEGGDLYDEKIVSTEQSPAPVLVQ